MAAIDSDLRIHWRPLTVLEISYRSVWTNVFWYVAVYMFWKCIQYTIHWDKTQTPFGQNKRYKKCPLFSFARSSPHRSFIFNMWFLYELKHKVRLSKTVRRVFHFSLLFLLKFIILFKKIHGLFDFKTS